MNIHQRISRFAPSDLERGVDVLQQFNNVIYLAHPTDGDAQALLWDTLDLWNQSKPYVDAVQWDVTSPADFTAPFVGLASMNDFREFEKTPDLANQLRFVLCHRFPQDEKRKKRVLIIGATALLGVAMHEVFDDIYEEVIGTGFSKAKDFGLEYLDITNEDEVSQFFDKQRHFDIMVYVSGEANTDIAQNERQRAYALNTEPVRLLAKHCSKTQFVYISTEYVFDGESAPYTSLSLRNPKNYYGETKKEAEDLVLELFANPLVIRMGALYGYNGPQDKKTTVGGLVQSLKANQAINVDEQQIKHPILLEDAALTLVKLLDYEATGIFQANGAIGVNKVELAKQMAEVWSKMRGKPFDQPIQGNSNMTLDDKPRDTEMVNVDTPRSLSQGMRYMMQEINSIQVKA